MTQKKAEILLATVIAARATSLLFSKIAMNGMGIFNLLAARFLMAFVLLAVVFFKRLRHIKRHTLVRGAIMGGLFFLMLSTELTGLKSTPLLHRLPAGEYRHHSGAHGGGRAAA